MSTAEAAQALGVSLSTVQRRCVAGVIPNIVIGGDRRVLRSAIAPTEAATIPAGTPALAREILADRLKGYPMLLDIEQVAEIVEMTQQAVYAAIRNGYIPSVRVGPRRIKVPTPALAAWLTQHDAA